MADVRRAMEMLLAGGSVSAADALRTGLVNHVVPARDVQPRARAIARKLSRALMSRTFSISGTAISRNAPDGGEDEDRTHDLRIANATLSQLSYPPDAGVV
jgi:enoyl-CoA hydratase/carnithine racemase